MDNIKLYLRDTKLFGLYKRLREDAALAQWVRHERPVPPPHAVKQAVLREYSRRYGLKVLVETGTFRGDMVRAMLPHFERIYTIELDQHLHQLAQRRFLKSPSVTTLHGDSANVLPMVLQELTQPALFWLDGHFSGPGTAKAAEETPLRIEINAVLGHSVPGHVVLVDDARCFGTGDYPSIETFTQLVSAAGAGRQVSVADDIVRVVPSSA